MGERITLITSGLAAGGSELQLTQLALGLQARGWKTSVISLQSGGVFHARLIGAGIPVYVCPVGRAAHPLEFVRLVRQLRATRPQLVHTQAFRANLWGRLAAFSAGRQQVPLIASVRATYSYLPRPYYTIERLLSKPTAFVVTPSMASSRYLIAPIGVDPCKVVTIPNGVDTALFSPRRDGSRFRSKWELGGSMVLLAPGRLVAQKNHAGLLRAFDLAAAQAPDATLVIAGSGPLEATIRAQAHSLGRRVRFTGELDRDAMADATAAADVVCLMSDFEGTPNVVLEAMSAGKPVLATAVDGVPEVVDDGVEGLLVPRGDVPAAAEAMVRLARSRELRRRLGVAGRARVEAEHSIDVNVERYVRLYERVLRLPRRIRLAALPAEQRAAERGEALAEAVSTRQVAGGH